MYIGRYKCHDSTCLEFRTLSYYDIHTLVDVEGCITLVEYFAEIQYGHAKAMTIMVLKHVEYYILERCRKVLRGGQKDIRLIRILSPNAFAKSCHGLNSKRTSVSRIRRAENFGVTGFTIDAECITREHQDGGRKSKQLCE